MRIPTRCSVALHCLVFIAEYGEREKVTGELLSASTGCNAVIIRGVLGQLRDAGIVEVRRGVGGARLVADPAQLTLWDVYLAVEPRGVHGLIGVHPDPNPRCPVGRSIEAVLDEPYRSVEDAVQAALAQVTLADLMRRFHEIAGAGEDTGEEGAG